MKNCFSNTTAWHLTAVATALFFSAAPSGAMPALSQGTNAVMNDGEELKLARRGDEQGSWYETPDGVEVVKRADGTWSRATVDRRREAHRHIHPGGVNVPGELDGILLPPGTGYSDSALNPGAVEGNVLFILIEYDDVPATYRSESEWAALLAPTFVLNSYPWDSSRSVQHYFAQASYEAVDIQPASESYGRPNNGVIGWLSIPGNHPDPGRYHDTDANAKQAAEAQIAQDAIFAADPYIDYSTYDSNRDGAVDSSELSIVIVVAGDELAYGATTAPSLWAHANRYHLVGQAPASRPDGVAIFGNIEMGEVHGTHRATLGTVVHELGHLLLGLPDLYDLDGSSPGIGNFGLMGTGTWGYDLGESPGETPVMPSAWTQYKLGWVSAAAGGDIDSVGNDSEPAAPARIGIANSLAPGSSNSCLADEYFLAQLRSNQGYDRGLNGLFGTTSFPSGLLVLHVDETMPNNALDLRRLVDVEEAPGCTFNATYGESACLWGTAQTFGELSAPSSNNNGRSESGVEMSWWLKPQPNPSPGALPSFQPVLSVHSDCNY